LININELLPACDLTMLDIGLVFGSQIPGAPIQEEGTEVVVC